MTGTDLLNYLNSASHEELTAIPGIGPSLAETIISARPFASREEVLNVRGIGEKLLAKLEAAYADMPETSPEPVVEPEESEPAVAQVEDEITLEPEEAPASEPEEQPEAARVAPAPAERRVEAPGVSRGTVVRFAIASGLISFLLAMILTLGFLAAVNGSLSYATSTQMRTLSNRAGALNTQLTTLQQDVDGLRTRMDTLEGLSGRMSGLESEQAELRSDLDAASQQLEQTREQVDEFAGTLAAQETRLQLFEKFLSGLQALLAEIVPQGGE